MTKILDISPDMKTIPMKDKVVLPPLPSMGDVVGGISFGGGDSTVPNANNRSITTIAAAINVEGNFVNEVINAKLDTSAKQILGDFTFGVSGAIKMITDADNGLWISPTGILAKKLGANTFTIGIDGSPTFAGTITASAGSIGGWAISATALYYDGATDAVSAGMASADYPFYAGKKYVDRATAPFKVTPAGALTATSATITGALTAGAGSSLPTTYLSGLVAQTNLNIANQGWTQTCAFSSTDLDTVSWGAGTLTTAGGTTYNIGAGNTGNMAARAYIYLDIGVSTTAYQTTTTASTAVGAGKVLVATAINGTTEARFQVFNGVGGLKIPGTDLVNLTVDTSQIAASAITTAKIAADAVTAAEIATGAVGSTELAVGAVIAGKITAGTIVAADIAAGTITGANIAATTITAANIAALTITASQIAANTITASQIVAGTITTTEIAANTIVAGNIAAGTITGNEIAASTITAGKISVSQLSAIAADMGSITAGSIGVNLLTAGTITSKAISLAIAAATGDSYIAGGNALDLTNWQGGDTNGGALILGLDDSDADKGKFFVGNYSTHKYIKFDGNSFYASNVKSIFDYYAGENLTAGNVVYYYGYAPADSTHQVFKASANYAGVRNSQVIGVVLATTTAGNIAQIQYAGLTEGLYSISSANQYSMHYLQNSTVNDYRNISLGGATSDRWLTGTGHRAAQIVATIPAGTKIDRIQIGCADSDISATGYVILQGVSAGKPDNNNLAVSNSVTITSSAIHTFEFPITYTEATGGARSIVLVWESGDGLKANGILNNPDGDLNTFVCTTIDSGTNWTVTTDDWLVYTIQYYTNNGLIGITPGTVSVKAGKAFGQSNLFLSNPANS